MNKKKKKKISKFKIFTILFVIGFLLSFYLSAYVSLILTKSDINFYSFLPHIIIKSIIENKNHLLIFASISLMTILSIVLVMINGSNNNNFASEFDEITDEISTPKAVGQVQHGSAKWLKPNEFSDVFKSQQLNSFNKTFAELLKDGEEDRKAVQSESVVKITKKIELEETENN